LLLKSLKIFVDVILQSSSDTLDLSNNDNMREYETTLHYMRYALAAYGWPLYMFMNIATGLCRILPRLRSVNCQCLVVFIYLEPWNLKNLFVLPYYQSVHVDSMFGSVCLFVCLIVPQRN